MKKTVIGIDPGQKVSGIVSYDKDHVQGYAIFSNEEVIDRLKHFKEAQGLNHEYVVAMEEFKNYGMGIGQPTIDSIFWSGRFFETWQPHEIVLIPRRTIATHVCGVARAGNSNIMHALIDRFTEVYADRLGIGAVPIKGTKKAPGPLYGISDHMWSALAVAVTWWDQNEIQELP